MEGVVANRYATALYEVAGEGGREKELYEELEAVDGLLRENPELLKLLGAPVLAKTERCEILDRVFANQISPTLLDFMKLLTEKGRIGVWHGVVSEYRKLYYEQNNIAVARVTTARPLTAELEASLREKLEKSAGKKLILETRVDETILGGVVVDLEGGRMDSSVRTRLGEIKKQISNGIA